MSGTQFSLSAYPSPKRRRSSSVYGTQSSAGGRKRASVNRMRIGRSLASKTPVFCETFNAGRITTNTSGIFAARMTSIAELSDYAALYRSYKILKLEWIIMPNANVATPEVRLLGLAS